MFKFLRTVFIVFLVLKLIGDIDWSWWLVCAPLYLEIFVIVANLIIYRDTFALLYTGEGYR